MKKSIYSKTAERLALTARGAILLSLIRQHGTPAKLAERLGYDQQIVRDWIYKGYIPTPSAAKVAETLGVDASVLRPDVDWTPRPPKEPKPPREVVARTADARLLVRLAEKYGSVEALCKAAYITTTDFANWKCRGRIPAYKYPTLASME